MIDFHACPSRWLIVVCLLGTTGLRDSSAQTPTNVDLAANLQPYVEQQLLAGAVMVVANAEGILDVESVGHADIAAKRPMTADAVGWIASMSKPITATALMLLVDEGKVALDDPISKHLPEFKETWVAVGQDAEHVLLKRPQTPVTVRHVLSHTSGMPFRSALEQPTLDALPLKVAVASYAMTPLQWEPGSKYQYSNCGINTAGRIIEVVSGLPYEDFLDQRLFGPLGMKDTTFWPNDEQVSRLAESYRPVKDQIALERIAISQLQYPLQQRAGRYPMPAGGLFSTAGDVTKFCRMILAGGELDGRRYVSEKSIREMGSNQTGELKQSYGLGWAAERNAGAPFGHGGAHSTQMSVDPGRRLVVVFMVQHAGYKQPEGRDIYSTFLNQARAAYGQK